MGRSGSCDENDRSGRGAGQGRGLGGCRARPRRGARLADPAWDPRNSGSFKGLRPVAAGGSVAKPTVEARSAATRSGLGRTLRRAVSSGTGGAWASRTVVVALRRRWLAPSIPSSRMRWRPIRLGTSRSLHALSRCGCGSCLRSGGWPPSSRAPKTRSAASRRARAEETVARPKRSNRSWRHR